MDAVEWSIPERTALPPVWGRMAKRSFDVFFGLIAFLLALPLIIILVMWIWSDTGESPVFRQVRIGKNGVPYRIYKLRTMRQNLADEITSVGHHLRRTHLDELPQIINVLVGEMSLVGPRPIIPKEHEQQCRSNQHHAERLAVLPGITGLAQVKAPRGTPDREEIWDEKDREYVCEWSLWLDIKIICQTIPQVLGRRGA